MKIKRLFEDDNETLGKEAEKLAKETNAEVSESETEDELFTELDRTLKYNINSKKRNKNRYDNIIITGDAGFAKSDRVAQWATSRGVNLFYIKTSSIDPTEFSGIQVPNDKDPNHSKHLSTTFFNSLDRPNSVLYLDEFNRGKSWQRDPLLELVNRHVIPDYGQPDGLRYFPNLLFTIVTINPADSPTDYNTDKLDAAEETRYHTIEIARSKKRALKYDIPELQRAADEWKAEGDMEEYYADLGKIRLIKAILGSQDFRFEGPGHEVPNNKPTNYRNFMMVIDACDGTKEDLISRWNMYCDSSQKPTIQKILNNNKEVWDKATMALKQSGAPDPKTPPETPPEEKNPFATKRSTSNLTAQEKDDLMKGYLQD